MFSKNPSPQEARAISIGFLLGGLPTHICFGNKSMNLQQQQFSLKGAPCTHLGNNSAIGQSNPAVSHYSSKESQWVKQIEREWPHSTATHGDSRSSKCYLTKPCASPLKVKEKGGKKKKKRHRQDSEIIRLHNWRLTSLEFCAIVCISDQLESLLKPHGMLSGAVGWLYTANEGGHLPFCLTSGRRQERLIALIQRAGSYCVCYG